MHTIQASRTPAASLDVPTREDGADEPSPSSTWSPSDRVPAVPAIHVPRERLLDQLDACVAQPVTLICAPTGWGKTTLAAYWIRAGRAPGPVAYARFQPNSGPMAWRHLVEAMAAAGLSTDPTTYPCRSTRRGERAVVILDDLHHVTNQAVLYRIERLVTRVGDRVAFVMLARSEPHLSLYRWRVRGQLIELRTDHLAFRQDEVAQVLARYGLRLPQPVRSALWRLTEGWPAALAVALAAMAGRREPERVITDLIWGEGGLNEEVGLTEYVRREILQHLDPDVRAVLLRTSILETVCPGLVEALTGHRNGVRILAQMSRSNALARFYGGAHAWYRYRRLLRVTLRAELYTSMPGQVAGLHRAAAGWYAANGMPSDAVEHALAGGDWVSAERLFQQYWPEVTGTSGRPMAPAADGQPPDDIARRPLLAFAHAISCRDTGDYAAMSAFIRLGERGLGEAPGPEMMEILVAMRLAEAQAVGDHERLAAIGRRLLAQTAEAAPGHRYADSTDAARAVAYIAIAAARLCTGDLNAADTATQQGLDVARQSGFGLLTVTALRQRAFVDLGRGRLSAAAATARRVIDRARDAGIVDAPCVGYARIVLAAVCLERGQLDDAEFHLQEGIATSTPYDPVATTVYALTLAEFHYDRGDYAEVVEALTTLRDQRTCPLPPALDAAVVVLEARLCIAIGQLGRARALLTDAGLVDRAPVQAALATARLELAAGRPTAALALTEHFDSPDSLVSAVEGLVLRAQALHQLGKIEEATVHVEWAIRVADPESIRRPFRGWDGWIARLTGADGDCEDSRSPLPLPSGPPGPSAPRSPAHLPARPPGKPPSEPVESLTERETLVLQYLRSVLSIAEIASMLNLSSNTVKTHVRHVYRKLGVSRRRDAVRRARELHLL